MATMERRINKELLKQFLDEKIILVNNGATDMLHAIISRATKLNYPSDKNFYWIDNGRVMYESESEPVTVYGRELRPLRDFFINVPVEESANVDNPTWPNPNNPLPEGYTPEDQTIWIMNEKKKLNGEIFDLKRKIESLESEVNSLKQYIADARERYIDNLSASIAYIELVKEAPTHRQKEQVAFNAISLLKSRRDNNPFPWEELPF